MDSGLIGDLIDRLATALELYARQWCDTPEDVVQEAFMALAGQSPAPANPDGWLFRVVRNRAITAGIASRRRRRHEVEAAAGAPWFEGAPTPGSGATVDPESAQAALSTLPVEQREVIVAHIWGGLTFEQIAPLAGISASTAHRLYHAGLTALRGRLGVPCRTNTPRPNPR